MGVEILTLLLKAAMFAGQIAFYGNANYTRIGRIAVENSTTSTGVIKAIARTKGSGEAGYPVVGR